MRPHVDENGNINLNPRRIFGSMAYPIVGIGAGTGVGIVSLAYTSEYWVPFALQHKVAIIRIAGGFARTLTPKIPIVTVGTSPIGLGLNLPRTLGASLAWIITHGNWGEVDYNSCKSEYSANNYEDSFSPDATATPKIGY